MEENSETKELERKLSSHDEKMAKIRIDLAVFQEQFKDLIVDSEHGIREAESIQKQAKALKGLVKAATELEWKVKKDLYDQSRVETEKLKKEYYEIRDVRKSHMDACANIFTGAKKKIEDYRAECVRKAEAEKARLAQKLKAREEAEAKKLKEKEEEEAMLLKEERVNGEIETIQKQAELTEPTPNQEGMKVVSETGVTTSTSCFVHGDYKGEDCPVCIKESTPTEHGQTNDTETTEPDAPVPPQKADEGQNEPVGQEFNIEVFDMVQFIGAIIRGERGATFDLLQPNLTAIKELAKTFDCKPGETIITGCRVKV